MNQKQQTRLIINQEWKETGGAIVPMPQSRMQGQPLRDQNYRPVCPQPRREVSTRRIMTLANRQLCHLTGNIMDHVQFVDAYGRIAVVQFIPAQSVDPIMPVPLVEFSGIHGWLHKMAFREMANLLMQLENRWIPVNTSRWYRVARANGRAMIKYSQKFLTPDEWAFYSEQVVETYTNPTRREWK